MNEVSTIATAYAIAGCATDATHVSSSGSALAVTGMANAFASVANLESLSTGMALTTTPAGNGAVPQSEINTLADILAACVNSNGAIIGPPDPSPCADVFQQNGAAFYGGKTPTETATAAIDIAHFPWAFVSGLFGLATPTSPFQPTLTVAPSDFTIAISYTGSGLSGPAGLAADASGDIWVADFAGSGLSRLSPVGAPLSGSGGFSGGGLNGPVSVAIDGSGNAWVTNYEGASLSKFNSSGSPVTGSPYTLGGLNSPWGIAIDQASHVWAANQGNNSISEFSSGGSPITGTGGITTGGLNYPLNVAIDVPGNVWVANGHAFSVSEFNSSGTANTNSPFSGGGLIAPIGIAIDGSGNVWATNSYAGNNSLSELNSSGTAVSGSSGYTGGGLATPYSVAIDGAGKCVDSQQHRKQHQRVYAGWRANLHLRFAFHLPRWPDGRRTERSLCSRDRWLGQRVGDELRQLQRQQHYGVPGRGDAGSDTGRRQFDCAIRLSRRQSASIVAVGSLGRGRFGGCPFMRDARNRHRDEVVAAFRRIQ